MLPFYMWGLSVILKTALPAGSMGLASLAPTYYSLRTSYFFPGSTKTLTGMRSCSSAALTSALAAWLFTAHPSLSFLGMDGARVDTRHMGGRLPVPLIRRGPK